MRSLLMFARDWKNVRGGTIGQAAGQTCSLARAEFRSVVLVGAVVLVGPVVSVGDRLASPVGFTVGVSVGVRLWPQGAARGLEPASRSAAAQFVAACLRIRELVGRREVIFREDL